MISINFLYKIFHEILKRVSIKYFSVREIHNVKDKHGYSKILQNSQENL
jgi:hypothetical protein